MTTILHEGIKMCIGKLCIKIKQKYVKWEIDDSLTDEEINDSVTHYIRKVCLRSVISDWFFITVKSNILNFFGYYDNPKRWETES